MSEDEVKARAASLFAGEGWPLIRALFADSETYAVGEIRNCPVGEVAQIAAVKLAHIEELRGWLRGIYPYEGDPFEPDRSQAPGHGPSASFQLRPDSESTPESEPEPEPDDYDF